MWTLPQKKKTVICSDSLTALESLCNLYSTAALTMQIQLLVHRLLHRHFQLIFCWVLSHVGIPGNELANQAAKETTLKSNSGIIKDNQMKTEHPLQNDNEICFIQK